MPATQPGTEGIVMKKANTQDFPGGSVVKTPHSYYIGLGSIPCKGTKILYAAQCGQKKQYKVNTMTILELAVQWDAGAYSPMGCRDVTDSPVRCTMFDMAHVRGL